MPTTHARIRTILDAHGISRDAIEARLHSPHSVGRPVNVDLLAPQFGARVVAAMLELLVERLRPGDVERADLLSDDLRRDHLRRLGKPRL